MAKMNIKKGDKVVVITGKDKGKEGKVTALVSDKGKVIVEKVNVITKHMKPKGAPEAGRHNQDGGSHRCVQCNGHLPQVR